ncbi:uncharacterized protein A4U43_C08F20590 [Asparagus officinalis]|nr:uncharacterized protein A4U43_C08F20590 [Asparagus officinalis]
MNFVSLSLFLFPLVDPGTSEISRCGSWIRVQRSKGFVRLDPGIAGFGLPPLSLGFLRRGSLNAGCSAECTFLDGDKATTKSAPSEEILVNY